MTQPGEADRENAAPGHYLSLGAAILLSIAVVGAVVVLAARHPAQHVAGTARPVNTFLPPPATARPSSRPSQPAATSTPPARTTAPSSDAHQQLAAHPLSNANAKMQTIVCSLTRFDPSDERQAAFFQEAKVCADAAWDDALAAAGLPILPIQLVTVQGGPVSTPCGPVKPTDHPTQCRATIYMTPAYLRDVEQLNRFPGKYFGVFLRTYASAVQEATGLVALQAAAKGQPGAAAQDLDARLAQQATCLAGAASGAMAGQGAIDTNITNEIRQRLSSVDAPADAAAWLAKGFDSRTFVACNTWS